MRALDGAGETREIVGNLNWEVKFSKPSRRRKFILSERKQVRSCRPEIYVGSLGTMRLFPRILK